MIARRSAQRLRRVAVAAGDERLQRMFAKTSALAVEGQTALEGALGERRG